MMSSTDVTGQPSPTDFGQGLSFVPDAKLGPDGAIYFLSLLGRSLHRMRYTPQLPAVLANSQARANDHSRFTVAGEMDSSSATSSMASPEK